MTTLRYLAIVPDGTENGSKAVERLVTMAARILDLQVLWSSGAVVVIAMRNAAHIPLPEGRGLILGSLFRRDDEAAPIVDADALFTRAVGASRGSHLIAECWGSYVAFLASSEGNVDVLRDPTGAIPVYRRDIAHARLFFSDMESALQLGVVAGDLDYERIAHHLVYDGLRTVGTCVRGVKEVLPGTRLTRVGSRWSSSVLWNPWEFASPDRQINDRATAVELLRKEMLRCVRVRAGAHRSITMELSGGLDSSIVAASLAQTSVLMNCVTLYTPDPGADERRWADAVARAIDSPLEEIALEPEVADITRFRPPHPRPFGSLLQSLVDDAFARAGAAHASDAFFGGSGGDYIFNYLGTSAPVADALRAHGPSAVALRALKDLSALHRITLWKGARLSLRKAFDKRPFSWKRQPLFLNAEALPDTPDDHPWLNVPAGAWPGKFIQISGIILGLNGMETKPRTQFAAVVQPILSQPLFELSLRIPSWMSISGGQNRSIARDAFANLLPEEVLNRSTKGNFTGINGAIYERNRNALRDYLLKGNLAGAGLLATDAVQGYLDSPGAPRNSDFNRLLRLGCAEAWTRSWDRHLTTIHQARDAPLRHAVDL